MFAALVIACGGDDGGVEEPLIQVSMSDAGCTPKSVEAEPGRTRFLIQNPTSSAAKTFELRSGDEVVLALYNVLGGISRGGSVTLEEGMYEMRCIGGGIEGTGVIRVAPAP